MNVSTVDLVIFAVGGYLAISVLTSMMTARRDKRLWEFQRELRKEKKRRAIAAENQRRKEQAEAILRDIEEHRNARGLGSINDPDRDAA